MSRALQRRDIRRAIWIAGVLLCVSARVAAAGALEVEEDLTRLSLEELVNVEVTTVSRRGEPWFAAPAAIYVITQDDIRRSGVTSVPEALRLAPGVQVARLDANKWAIGVRGFGSRLSRSVLVLIDGRSVYSPLFAGTYWEVHDLLLEDIDRIEVIRGPGGTQWGANAFSGVIHIVTKNAADTQGGLVKVIGGTEEHALLGLRYGDKIGDSLFYRLYGKVFDRDGGHPLAGDEFDDWRMGRVGMRVDYAPRVTDHFALHTDLYVGRAGQRTDLTVYAPPSRQTILADSALLGGNAYARWLHTFSATSESKLRFYYDRTNRRDPNFNEERDTVDLDLDHRFGLPRQEILWGVAYRLSSATSSAPPPSVVFRPFDRTDHLVSAFLQDQISIVEGCLRLIVGTKIEHNDYSGFEIQPSGRLLFLPHPGHVIWAGFSRAIRSPSRVEHDLEITALLDPATSTFARVLGTPQFQSEKVYTTEGGYRVRPTSNSWVSLAAFYNVYADLFSLDPGMAFSEDMPPPPRTVTPYFIRNGFEGTSYGIEITHDWEPTSWLDLQGSYSLLHLDLQRRPGNMDPFTEASTEGSSPQHQVSFRFGVDLPASLELDGFFRFVDELPAQRVAAYGELDLRLGWRARPSIMIDVVGQNLLHARHAEFAAASLASAQPQRGVYGRVTWRF